MQTTPEPVSSVSSGLSHVAIIGGGITGLATAYYLQEGCRALTHKRDPSILPLTYTLLESAPRPGGKIITETSQGFLIEGGPDCFITQKPAAVNLGRELGLGERLIGTNDAGRKVYVVDGGRLQPMPDGMMLVIPTRFSPFIRSPLISLAGKLRMGLDLIIPPRHSGNRMGEGDDESLASFIRRRLGQEALEKIAEPLMAGIHVADPQRLSIKSTFPRLVEVERRYGSLIKGMMVQRKRRTARGAGRSGQSLFMTLRGGLGELVETLVTRLEGRLLTGTRLVGLEKTASPAGMSQGGYRLHLEDGQTLSADLVVMATPAYVTAELIEPLQPTLAGKLRAIRYVSTVTVSLGFRQDEFEHPLDGFGFVVAAREPSPLLACSWSSTKFSGRAPDGHVLVRGFMGGYRNPALLEESDERLVELFRGELRRLMGITRKPVITRVFRWHRANPQYDVGHLERVAEIESLTATLPGLYLTGHAYRGVGIPDCIGQAKNTAETIIAAVGKGAGKETDHGS